MHIKFVDLKEQYLSIKKEIDQAVQDVILESAFIGGPYVAAFEKSVAEYIGVTHCIGVGNGTDALYISLKALGIKPGDEVITAVNTFIATSEAVTRAGAKVVFVDCDKDSYNIDVKKIKGAVTKKTKAIIPVHLYGQPADMEEIMELAHTHRLKVIEDAAQAHGATYKGKKVGGFGDCGCFSFYAGKNLGAYGDGGAIVTNNDELAAFARLYANHGRMDKYNHAIEGINSRLDGIQAAVLNVKLKYLDKWNNQRKKIAALYDEGLPQGISTPKTTPASEHVYHLYVVQVPNREKLQALLAEKGIDTGIHYPMPLPFLRAYEHLGHKPEDFPVAHSLKDKILSLPIHGNMAEAACHYVIDTIRMFE